MAKYHPQPARQEATASALRAAMRADAAHCRREAVRQDGLKARGNVKNPEQYTRDPCYRRFQLDPFPVGRLHR